MGRELRKVIKNWDHPKIEGREDSYQPMFDQPYIERLSEWIDNHKLWEEGKHPDQPSDYRYFAEWDGGPPDLEYYRPDWREEDMTWFQVYETVSEGTPVTPPFETKEELVEYLVENGDFWDQSRRKNPHPYQMPCEPWQRKHAENFVFGSGWAPSGIVANGKVMSGVEGLSELNPNPHN